MQLTLQNLHRATLSAMLFAFSMSWQIPAQAHEFWIMPSTFKAAPGTPLNFGLHVGEHFEGDNVPLNRQYVRTLRHHSSQGVQDLSKQLPASGQASPDFAFHTSGTHVLSIDTHPNQVSLSADSFHAYLHEEGLDSIIKMREAAGKEKTPGRERYRRHIKTLLHIDGAQKGDVVLRTGQRLEIVPLALPAHKSAGDSLDFQLLFDSKPLTGALVKAWHKHDGQTVVIRTVSNKEGTVRVTLPFAGPWMISTVHMIAAVDAPEVDWESFWGNLTFELPAKRPL